MNKMVELHADDAFCWRMHFDGQDRALEMSLRRGGSSSGRESCTSQCVTAMANRSGRDLQFDSTILLFSLGYLKAVVGFYAVLEEPESVVETHGRECEMRLPARPYFKEPKPPGPGVCPTFPRCLEFQVSKEIARKKQTPVG
jgi:hypothetical protein